MSAITVIVILFFAIIVTFAVIGFKTDWDKLDRNNERFFVDKDGNHSYYDRHKNKKAE